MFNNILYINRAQTTISALAEIMDYVRRHHSNDPDGWSGMIEELKKILILKDMGGLSVERTRHIIIKALKSKPDLEYIVCWDRDLSSHHAWCHRVLSSYFG